VSPTFLTLDEALALHAAAIERFGGSLGLRDAGLLQSALGMPQASFGGEWLHPSIHEMAAAYLFHICKNHPFVDGNKRAALICTIVFLGANGHRVSAPDDALYDIVIGVAAGRVSKAEAAVFLEKHTKPLPR
jgi:death-on-curing protein